MVQDLEEQESGLRNDVASDSSLFQYVYYIAIQSGLPIINSKAFHCDRGLVSYDLVSTYQRSSKLNPGRIKHTVNRGF
jgi:hypothetical protein